MAHECGRSLFASARNSIGAALTAAVQVSGLSHVPDRILWVHLDGSDVAVRHSDRRLLWVATSKGTAFRRSDDNIGYVEDSGEPVLLPRDTGAEARAILSLDALCDWANAEVIAANGMEFSLLTEEDETLSVRLHEDFKIVMEMIGPESLSLRARSIEVGPRKDAWFAVADL